MTMTRMRTVVNEWMDWTDDEQLISDQEEPGTVVGGLQDIWTGHLLRTGYFHVKPTPGGLCTGCRSAVAR